MDYLQDVLVAIKPVLKQYGCRQKNLNWLRETNAAVFAFSIQKSQYSRKVYLNIGISIKAIAPELVAVSYQCPIQARLDHLIGYDALDFEMELDPIARGSRFVELLQSNPYEFFTLTGTKAELVDFINASGTMVVSLQACKYLGIPNR